MANCVCGEMPDVFYYEDVTAGFEKHLREVSIGDWVLLQQCQVCGTLWAIDGWDKYQHQVAARVAAKDDWQSASEEQRKDLLLKSRGGEEHEHCIWAGCNKWRIKGVVFCINHLWEMGARK